jgi:hypothetical protein
MRLHQNRVTNALSSRAVCRESKVLTMEQIEKELKALYDAATSQGWRIEPTNNGKLMWYPPTKDQPPVVTSTQVYGRGLKNITAALRRAGLNLPNGSNPKAKPLIGVLGSGEEIPEGAIELFETEKVMEKFLGEQATKYDKAVAAFLGNTIDSLGKFTELLALYQAETSGHGHTDDEYHQAVKDLSEALALYDESDKHCQELISEIGECQRRLEKAEKDMSRLGAELQETRTKLAAQTERASAAENDLATIRKIFQGNS